MPSSYTSHCRLCPYYRCGPQPLSMEWNPCSDVLLIFQAPGQQEWQNNKPICSTSRHSAAARIRDSLCRIGKQRQDYSITNSVQCFPGTYSSGRDKRPKARARCQCAHWLRADIGSTQWRKVIVFGAIAKKTVIGLGLPSYANFTFLKHPSGGLTNRDLDIALR